MSFRGGGDAGGRAPSRAGPEYIRNVPKFLQKYEHLLEKREGQKVVRTGLDGSGGAGAAVDVADDDDDEAFEDQIRGATIAFDERDPSSWPSSSGPPETPEDDSIPKWSRLKDKGNEAFGRGEHKEAIKLFTQAILLDPHNSVLHSNRAAAHAALHQYDSSLADAKKALALQPGWAKAHSRIGAALFGLKRYEEAVGAYKKAVQAEKKNKTYQEALEQANAKLRQIEDQEAESGRHVFRKRKQGQPTSADAAEQSMEGFTRKASVEGKVAKPRSTMLSFSED